MNNPQFLKSLIIRLIQNNDKAIMNKQGNIYAKMIPIILCARILKKEINTKEINILWHKYNQARISKDSKKIAQYYMELDNQATINYHYVIEFQKEYENVNINDDSKKDCWSPLYIGILSSDDL